MVHSKMAENVWFLLNEQFESPGDEDPIQFLTSKENINLKKPERLPSPTQINLSVRPSICLSVCRNL
jgi:hypothetical protein